MNSETFVDQEARFALKVTLKIRKPFTGNVLVDAFPTPYESYIVSNAAPTRDSRILRLSNDALNRPSKIGLLIVRCDYDADPSHGSNS